MNAVGSRGYSFVTSRTLGGVALLIRPVINGRPCGLPRLYAFTPDEVRALRACLDILPDDRPH